MYLPLQMVDQTEIAQADSLFRAGLETRVQTFANMTWGERFSLIGNDLWDIGLKIVVAVAIIIVGRWIIRRVDKGLGKLFGRLKVDHALRTFFRSALKTLLYFIMIYIVVAWLGVNTSLFVVLFAAAGLAIGMAMSGMFQNVAGGVMVLVQKPFQCGDWIELEGVAGTVVDIRLFNTLLRTADNRTVSLPNGGVSTSVMTNYSSARTRRLEWAVSLSIGTDFDAVRKTLLNILAAEEKIVASPAPEVVMDKLNSDSIDVRIRGWVATADYWDVYYRLNEVIYKTLPEKEFDLAASQSINVTLSK